jgi:formamidopyrimidine-DNA glycosylase
MPERPDLDHLQPRMNDRLRGQTIIRFTLAAPVVLRNLTGGDPRTLLPGLVIQSLTRHRASLLFDLGPLLLVVNPMLAGRFSLGAPTEKAPRDLAFALDLADNAQLRFVDSESMSKVTLLTPDQRAAVPDLGPAGLDLRAPAFTPEALRTLLKGRREQLKTFLLDKTALDCLGNAYADEVLFAAGLHPKTRAGSLDPKAVAALHAGITATLDAAAAEFDRRQPAWDDKVRDFLSVRNRKGQPCPRCGDPIRVCGVNGHDAFFCARCQPDAAKKGLVDWTRLPARSG